MIKRLHVPYIARTIPLAFDESLSYLETLYAILKKLNGVIDTVNQHTEILEEMGDTINSINEEIVNLNIKLDNLENWVTNYVEENIDNLKSQVNEQLADLLKNVNTLLDNMKTVIDNEISSLRDELMAEIDEIQAGLIEIYNPFTGLIEPISKVIIDMYNSVRDEAITSSEYDGLELTAKQYDDKQITAIDYDLRGKTILMGIPSNQKILYQAGAGTKFYEYTFDDDLAQFEYLLVEWSISPLNYFNQINMVKVGRGLSSNPNDTFMLTDDKYFAKFGQTSYGFLMNYNSETKTLTVKNNVQTQLRSIGSTSLQQISIFGQSKDVTSLTNSELYVTKIIGVKKEV